MGEGFLTFHGIGRWASDDCGEGGVVLGVGESDGGGESLAEFGVETASMVVVREVS